MADNVILTNNNTDNNLTIFPVKWKDGDEIIPRPTTEELATTTWTLKMDQGILVFVKD